ncbi:MAG: DNA helicase RecQ [Candidatus Omnitrophota bacterium]
MEKKNVKDKRFELLKQYWGYTSFRPLQEETVDSILEGKDSLTMLPTGGGKSLCFQLPAMIMAGMAVVVSPLISLMKDQVDGLMDMGIPAACLNSSMPGGEQMAVINKIRNGAVKLLYLSPERLQMEGTLDLLRSASVSFFVIDEAHCISHWGHDFRADYRNLWIIKKEFMGKGIHAFTATATELVQKDIMGQLKLNGPAAHIGRVDRPNLTYRVIPRAQIIKQITGLLEKHKDEPGIIYCLRRKDVDDISAELNSEGFKNVPYHAGLTDEDRHVNQDRFVKEEINIIVATVAFGMGIDRSNIRYVIHAAMPKSIEHYQQETGRAGRDGLPSSCYMFYGGGDYRVWSHFAEQSSEREVMLEKLNYIYNFSSRPQCRHKVLVEYFGQGYERSSCEACDYCLNEVEMVDDPLTVAQKILSAVVKVKRFSYGFGAAYIVNVLRGKEDEKISSLGHDQLSVYGIMPEDPVPFIRYMIEQLIGQGFLERVGEFSTLEITDAGKKVLRGETIPVLARPMIARKKKEIAKKRQERQEIDWAGIDRELFRRLREKRAELAQQKGVPAYIIFSDNSLKDMATKEPLTKEEFAGIYGVGQSKLVSYAGIFIQVIKDYHKYVEGFLRGGGTRQAG